MKKIIQFTTIASLAFSWSNAYAGDQIRAVGSSTVYPFISIVAEKFGKNGNFKTPIVESIGTGGGFKLFCASSDGNSPDISNASRAIKDSEKELCKKNGVNDITELKIGYDGIVIANVVGAPKINFTTDQIFKALAKQVPQNGKLAENPYQKWSDIDKKLPDVKIEVYGPPPTSGTRDAFVELVMEKACKDLPEFKTAFPDEKERAKACHALREDGKYIDSGENDNLIVQKIEKNKDAFGIFGYSFLSENASAIQASSVNGAQATFDKIVSGDYPVSRPLFVYIKDGHLGKTLGLKEFVNELISDKAIGEEGYLADKGLIPLHKAELVKAQDGWSKKQ